MKKRMCCLILAAILLSGCAAGQNDPSTEPIEGTNADAVTESCLLYTSDAADD